VKTPPPTSDVTIKKDTTTFEDFFEQVFDEGIVEGGKEAESDQVREREQENERVREKEESVLP
jgi:hypothetical protein